MDANKKKRFLRVNFFQFFFKFLVFHVVSLYSGSLIKLISFLSDPNDINAAIPIANQIKAANVTINIVGLGQNSSSPLANLATNYIGLPFIGGPYDASINWATLKSCTYDGKVL